MLPKHLKWKPPAPLFVKLNFDGSVKYHHQAATNFVLRDGHDISILVSATQLGYVDVLIAEAMALCEGVQQALCKGYDTIHIEGDSLLLS